MAEGVSRGYVFVAVLLFTFTFLIAMAPAQFVGETPDYDILENPDSWYAEEIAIWSDVFRFYDDGVLPANSGTTLDVGTDHDFVIYFSSIDDVIVFQCWHQWSMWGIIPRSHNIEPSPFGEDHVLDNIEPGSSPEISRFMMTCSHYTWAVRISYDDTKFDSLYNALHGIGNDAEVLVFAGLTWDQEAGAINAWNVIGQILTFQSPDVHPVINALIAVPLWICIIYLAYRIVLMMIPFVGA